MRIHNNRFFALPMFLFFSVILRICYHIYGFSLDICSGTFTPFIYFFLLSISKIPGDDVLFVSPGSSRPLSWRPERTATNATSTARSAASRRRPSRRRCGRTRSGRRGARRRSGGSRSAASRRPSRRRRRRGGSPRRKSGASGCVSWRLTCWMRSLRSRTADVGRPLEY